MKPKIWRVLLSLLLLFLTACGPESPLTRSADDDDPEPVIDIPPKHTGKKIALVIGNWAYKFKPLNNPQNDAREMTQLLRQLGFEVIHRENLGFDEMQDEVIQVKVELIKRGQVGLFYFSGHGLEVQKENYLLPTDLHKPETELVKEKSIRAQWVVNVMEHTSSQVNIVILDACRKFPRPDIPRATSEEYGLAAMSATKGTIIGFATGSGRVASDGKKGTNGLYTGYLLKFMRQPGLTIEEVFKKTRQQVAFETRQKPAQQVPWVSNSLIGDFCLVSCVKPKPKQEKILQAQLEQERREKILQAQQLEQERREKEALQRQLDALKNQPVPEPVVIYQAPEPVVQDKFFQDRLADGSLGPEMVWIPAGSFRMGDIQGGGDDDEKPVHRVSVKRFAMGRYEVTVGEFRQFVNATGYKTEAEKDKGCYTYGDDWGYKKDANWRNPYFSQNNNQPVVCVSWNDATTYVEWLSQQTGKTYRLPTEAEWEYTARAKTTTSRYWGNNPDDACRYANIHDNTSIKEKGYSWEHHHKCTDGYVKTAPVGKFRANGFGLYDTIGNVWEWVADGWHKDYTNAPNDGGIWEKDADKGRRVLLRGGSWDNFPSNARAAVRLRNYPDVCVFFLGFRVFRRVARTY